MSIANVSILAGAGALEPLPAEAMSSLEHVEIVMAIGERGSFRLAFRLEAGSTLPERFLLDSGDLVRMVLSVGAGNDHAVAMDGVIVQHSVSTRTNGNGPVLILAGEDLTLLMDLTDTGARPFPGMAIETRVQVILAAYSVIGVTPHVVRPPIEDVPAPAHQIPSQHGTDYAYMRLLAASVGHRLTLDPGPQAGASVAYWGPEPRADRSRPPRVIDLERPSEVEALQLRFDAIRRVQPDALILELPSKTLIPIPVPDIALLGSPLGAVVPPAHKHRHGREMAKLTVGQAASALLAEASRSAEAMTGLGTLTVGPGAPRLRAGNIVEVRGASKPFSGLFAVSRVRDTITAGRHRQVFELLRAGLGATRRPA
jgi:hypothetical protein